MNLKWKDKPDGSVAELRGDGFEAYVCQPKGDRNWLVHLKGDTEIGSSLSLASGRIDAVLALRRLTVKLVQALGGTITWESSS